MVTKCNSYLLYVSASVQTVSKMERTHGGGEEELKDMDRLLLFILFFVLAEYPPFGWVPSVSFEI